MKKAKAKNSLKFTELRSIGQFQVVVLHQQLHHSQEQHQKENEITNSEDVQAHILIVVSQDAVPMAVPSGDTFNEETLFS